jgi:hypothetical protein
VPNFSSPSYGNFQSVSAVPLRDQTLTFAVGGIINSNELFSDGLPALCVWLLEAAGGPLVSVIPQFAWNNTAGGGPNWQPLAPSFALVPGAPSLTKYPLGSRRFRLAVTSAGATTVFMRLTGALT